MSKKAWRITVTVKQSSGMTVAEWLNKHIDSLSGVDKSTSYAYRAYVRNDIASGLATSPSNCGNTVTSPPGLRT